MSETIINNEIEESYCSIEVSRLLKEKKFEAETYAYFLHSDEENEPDFRISNKWINRNLEDDFISAPTHGIAIEWIRVNFNHDIESRGVRYAGDEKSSYYQAYVNGCVVSMERYNTPSEAIEAALLYTLENLI